MKIATWNVNGIRARQAQFLAWCAIARPDVICLQETKAALGQIPADLLEMPGYWNCWHGAAGGYSGVSLHLSTSSFPDRPLFSHPAFDMETRIVQARVGDLVFASVYVPNGGKDYAAKLAFLTAMQQYVHAVHTEGAAMILCGDMNVARTDADIHPTHNKPGIIGTRPDERLLLDLMIGEGLIDVARMLEPENNRLFTWWPYWRTARQRNLGWRIDYIFASEAIARHAVGCTVFREVGTSDHAPVMAVFA